ncbi:MAG TPA: methylenetetrahydrofolate reductase [Candidatus Thermoplasmatota archaeon]|nr:methylenetetrahydrofolate reductase [Candidatus Thermoplasmatota archaeon]
MNPWTAVGAAAPRGDREAQPSVSSNLSRLLEARAFVCTSEVTPPRGADASALREKARVLRGCADAVNITDNQTARVHMSSLAGAVVLRSEGVEPVLQVTTRDRNRLALQSDLLGASALGVRNILCLGGDPIHIGNDPTAKAVHDLDAAGLIGLARRLRDESKDFAGTDLSHAPHLLIGGTCNPFGGSTEVALRLLGEKVAAGADFFQTQAVFDLEKFEAFLGEARSAGALDGARLLVGIIPLKSAKTAHYLAEKVPGIVIPKRVLEEIDAASDPAAYGKRLAVEIIDGVRELRGVAGVHIMAINWEEAVRPIMDEAGLLPRPPSV